MNPIGAYNRIIMHCKRCVNVGDRYWELSGNTLVTGFPLEGRPLTALGLPSEVDHIDAAFVWGYNGRIYLVSGYAYWKMEFDGRTVVQHDYPRDMSLWAGVPIPLDDAVTMPYPDGQHRPLFYSYGVDSIPV